MVFNQRLQLWKYFLLFFICSFLPEASCAKKLAHCDDSCLTLFAVWLPGNSALQNKADFYLRIVNASNSPSSAYSSQRTQRNVPQCALKTLVPYYSAMDFISRVSTAWCYQYLRSMAVKRMIQRVLKRNPNLNSAESSLLTFFQESLKKLKKLKKNKKDWRKH